MVEPDGYDWGDLALLVEAGKSYRNAPIVEAAIELRTEPDVEPSLEQLKSVLSEDNNYLDPGATYMVQGQVEMNNEGVTGSTTGQHVGFTFQRKDERQFVQVLPGRIAVSQLPPYTGWDTFLQEAKEVWSAYGRSVGSAGITGAGVRFINKIVIPSRSAEIRDYLRTSVDVSPYLPQAISGLTMQVDIPLRRFGSTVRITSALLPLQPDEQTALVLDLDVQKDFSTRLSHNAPLNELDQMLQGMREAKNFVFEACITDATRRLID